MVNRIRNIFILLLLTALMFSGLVTDAKENAETKYSKEVTFLYDMGIINSYSPEATVTKQMIQNSIELIGAGALSAKYFDCNDYTEPATLMEVAAVLSDLTGRGAILNKENVLSVAANAGITRGINLNGNDYVTMECYANMLYQALTADLMEVKLTNNQTKEYTVSKNKTYLSDCMYMSEIYGIITATEKTGLYSESNSARENYIQIDNEKFLLNGTQSDYGDILGMSVTALYSEKNGEKEIISLYFSENDNQTITVTASDLVKDKSGTGHIYSWENSKKEYIIDEEAAFIYNGFAVEYINDDDICINEGHITLIDNNNDSKYDVVKITSVESTVVTQISETYKYLVGKNGIVYDAELLFNPEPGTVLNEKGNKTEFSSIKKGNVISIGYKKNTNKVALVQIGSKITGKVNSFNSDGSICIDEENYDIAFSLRENKSGFNLDRIKLGVGVSAYLNAENELVGAEITSNDDMYGYMTKLYSENGPKGDVRIRIFASDGEFHEYVINDKVIFDSERIDSSKLLDNKIRILWDGDALKDQPILYRINGDGKLVSLYTAIKNTNYGAYNLDKFSLDYSGELRYLGGDWSSLGGLYTLKSDTVVFNIPNNIDDADLFYTVSPTGWGAWTFDLELYDVDEEMGVGMVILRKSDYKVQQAEFNGNQPIIVKNIVMTIDETGDIVYKVKGWRNGAEYSINTRSVDTFATRMPNEILQQQGLSLPTGNGKIFSISELKPGSVIQPRINKDKLTGFTLYYDGKNKVYYEYSTYKLAEMLKDPECMFLSGRINSLTKNGFLYIKNSPEEEESIIRNIRIGAGTKIYLVENGDVFECTRNELSVNDNVLLYYNYSSLSMIVIQR